MAKPASHITLKEPDHRVHEALKSSQAHAESQCTEHSHGHIDTNEKISINPLELIKVLGFFPT